MEAEHGDVWEALRPLCARVMSVPAEAVVPHARLVADLGADSLDITELEVASEEMFGVSLRGTDKAGVSTVGDVADLIERLRAGAPGLHSPVGR
ncbi:acyl carrier protein [Streptomyces sp. SS1-1]|uniref:acyl carrier protein n=1 Tax=unclassified Streptomyces TaxID=2593676 RepID=UPI0012507145|nr:MULTISPECIES: acyl carrier protein [unclassified Streptomyces]KAB2973432.1 acyl carrier protein [Streptomyces sp. SS1-1]MDI9835887.1 acyl carrier protein [Streptomyces sp. KAU_LT]